MASKLRGRCYAGPCVCYLWDLALQPCALAAGLPAMRGVSDQQQHKALPPLPPCPARPAALYDGQQVPLRVRPWHGPRPQGRRAAASGAGGAGAGGLPPPAPRSRGAAGGGECVWGCVCRRGEPAAWAIHFATLRCAVHASVPWTKPAHPLPAFPCALLQCAAGVPPSVVARAAAGSAVLLDALLACGASVSGQQQQQQSSNGAAAGATEQGAAREVQGWSVLESGRGSLPLLHAAWFGWEAVQRLLERGADVNERSAEGGCVCYVLGACHCGSPAGTLGRTILLAA